MELEIQILVSNLRPFHCIISVLAYVHPSFATEYVDKNVVDLKKSFYLHFL